MKKLNEDTKIKIQKTLVIADNWRPHYSKISQQTGLHVTTVWENIQKMRYRIRLSIIILPEYQGQEGGGKNGKNRTD